MATQFRLTDNLGAKTFLIDLDLSKVLLEDNRHYPWIMLVPMRENVKNMTHLTRADRLKLMEEIAIGENVIQRLFSPDQINTAAIGNLTPQLHIHIVGRKIGDPDWPNTVWGRQSTPYDSEEKFALVKKLRSAFEEELFHSKSNKILSDP
ncbi:MAG: HIT family protein [Puniceicoccales bacterium]|jgi:diadenosine tetraphosphate (Ap4A) HIT family hydrolase|nr:HIT family protein [Puniceicoccales bacterium]